MSFIRDDDPPEFVKRLLLALGVSLLIVGVIRSCHI